MKLLTPARRSVVCSLITLFVFGMLAWTAGALPGDGARAADVPLNENLVQRSLTIERHGEAIARFVVEIADTAATQQIGLMGRTELAADRGMLFIWDTPGIIAMWMRNTLIPLDFIFVRADGTIVHIDDDVQPCPADGACPAYASPEPITMVLEVAGGRAATLGLRAGDRLVLGDEVH